MSNDKELDKRIKKLFEEVGRLGRFPVKIEKKKDVPYFYYKDGILVKELNGVIEPLEKK